MNFEEEAERIALEMAQEKKRAWLKSPKFLSIKGISKDDLVNGSSYVEKLKWPPWDKRNDVKGAPVVNQTNLVGFGKYAAKTVEWVQDNDENYFNWASENVPKFAAKVKQLGL